MGIKFDEKSKTYQVSVHKRHPISRQPISKSRRGIKSEREARRVYSDLVIQIEDSLRAKVIPLWPVFLADYITKIDRENELTKGTVYKRDKVLRKHTMSWGNKRVDQITGQNIRDLLHEQLSKSSESHRKFFLKGIRGVMHYALDIGLIDRDPTPKIKFKIRDKIHSVLKKDEILILLRKAQELDWEWYPHYAVALYTGLRSGEMYALRWASVDLAKRQILVCESWSSKDGFKSTKSGHDRVVEIPKPLLPVLKELRVQSGHTNFVLPRLWKWEQGEQARILKMFLKSIGLPEVRFHDLRASWATLLLGNGVPPSQVMAMGGWSDMKTMMIYMRKAGIDIKDSTQCLDNMQIHGVSQAKIMRLNAPL